MARFEAVEGLDELVAQMVAPEVRKVARRVERRAKRTAPPAKRWVSLLDDRERDEHRNAHFHPAIPSNVRFEIEGRDWDVRHGLSPGTDWLMEPRDHSTGLPGDSAQHIRGNTPDGCRCHAVLLPAAIAKTIKTERMSVYGTEIRVAVSCSFYKIVECEFGDGYETARMGTIHEPGMRFMGKAAAHVAATTRSR